MDLDHSKATVRITLDGLFLFCFKKEPADPNNPTKPRKLKWCEIGIINSAGHPHDYSFKIKQLRFNGGFVDLYTVTADKEVSIQVVNKTSGAHHSMGLGIYESPDRPFDRLTDKGDQKDFRWVLDFEKESETHKKVNLKMGGATGLRANRLTIYDGQFYTELKTYIDFDKVEKGPTPSIAGFGKIAGILGIDIPCPEGLDYAVRVKYGPGADDKYDLPNHYVVGSEFFPRYEIAIKNVPTDGGTTQSHFPAYYDALEDAAVSGKQFDLCRKGTCSPPGGGHGGGHDEDHTGGHEGGSAERDASDLKDVRISSVFPLVCDPAYLSEHDELK